MKALTIRQPWASLIALGVKTIETRTWRAPKSLIGQRIAIHAGKAGPMQPAPLGDYCTGLHTNEARHVDDCDGFCYEESDDGDELSPRCAANSTGWRPALFRDCGSVGWVYECDLPIGAIVATATLADCVPMVDYPPREYERDSDGYLQIDGYHLFRWPVGEHDTPLDVSDQLPYGDFRPGRWAWLLTDIDELLEPIPAKGKQGLWKWTQ